MEKGDWRREIGEGRRETGEGRREKGDWRREKGEGRREKGEGRREDGLQGRPLWSPSKWMTEHVQPSGERLNPPFMTPTHSLYTR
jgi:hypothetical protein